MTPNQSSRFAVPTEAQMAALPEDMRNRMLKVQQKIGFVPNVFLMLARRPEEFRAFFSYHDALMEKEIGLSKAEREMIVVATSAANHCVYCVVAHGAVLRIRARDPLIADVLAVNPRKAMLSARQHAMLRYALKVATNSSAIEDDDLASLRTEGFDDEAIWDIGAIAAFFAMSNRLANFTGMQPNAEFHMMGRS